MSLAWLDWVYPALFKTKLCQRLNKSQITAYDMMYIYNPVSANQFIKIHGALHNNSKSICIQGQHKRQKEKVVTVCLNSQFSYSVGGC